MSFPKQQHQYGKHHSISFPRQQQRRGNLPVDHQMTMFLRRKITSEVQKSIHFAITDFEESGIGEASVEEVRQRAEIFLKNSQFCGSGHPQSGSSDFGKIIRIKNQVLDYDLWTQALLSRFDPICREVHRKIQQILKTDPNPPTDFFNLLLRLGEEYPFSKTKTPWSAWFAAGPEKVPKNEKEKAISLSYADAAKRGATHSPGVSHTFYFSSQAIWIGFRLYAYCLWKQLPLKNVMHPERWQEFDKDIVHKERIAQYITECFKLKLVNRVEDECEDLGEGEYDEKISVTPEPFNNNDNYDKNFPRFAKNHTCWADETEENDEMEDDDENMLI
jgi:hypothetical protein